MHPRDFGAVAMSRFDLGEDFIKRQRRGVDDPRAQRRGGDNLARHQRARIQAHCAALDQAQPAHRDQIGRAGPGADEMHRHRPSTSK